MKTTFKAIIAAVALSAASAHAAIVTETQNQTVNGQNFTFALGTPGYAANTASSLTLTVQGDFNGESGEFVTVFVEGVNRGTFGAFSPQAYGVVDYRSGTQNFNALKFNLDFLLSGSDTNGYLADGDLDVLIDFNDGVTAMCGWSGPSNCQVNVGTSPYAQLNFNYVEATAAVPEPASLALFGLGLAGFAAARRRNAKQA